ncbi:LOW QUALITY PROTEIN: hypothetical protein PHMEG_00029196 [Phytophthora megakarya]|uniref:Uncharacterized protein n=1 Tax=Phytophthora megakarya TaxID=4795 RepID=A0A225V364_9STRA|nr:LOW QUALITY PROTEIN: hypothetical protein PHMEG_00029196 [Phytophthora megakarya]
MQTGNRVTNTTEQRHRLVNWVSGTFKGASHHWGVSEKEVFYIIKATDLDLLLIRSNGFCLYSSLVLTIKKHFRGKLQARSLTLNQFPYTNKRISGEKNVWAEIVSHWTCVLSLTEQTSIKR